MRAFFLALTIGVSLSNLAWAADQCTLKALDGGQSGTCSDDEFTQALWVGDITRVNQMLDANPNFLFSCNFSPSFVYGDISEMMNPLIFSVCHSSYKNMRDLVSTILVRSGDNEVNCETANLKITAKFCVDRISDANLRSDVENLLKRHGMN